MTYWAQLTGGATRSLENYPFGVRQANASVAYVRYLGKAVWPANLALFYPHAGRGGSRCDSLDQMGTRFHLSFCVADLSSTSAFYGGVLECAQGAVHPKAVDFSFYGHQITCHLDPTRVRKADINTLDGNHFGVILDPDLFHRVAQRLKAADAHFIVAPTVQREGTPSERWKMIVADPSGNALEFKCYRDESQIFTPA